MHTIIVRVVEFAQLAKFQADNPQETQVSTRQLAPNEEITVKSALLGDAFYTIRCSKNNDSISFRRTPSAGAYLDLDPIQLEQDDNPEDIEEYREVLRNLQQHLRRSSTGMLRPRQSAWLVSDVEIGKTGGIPRTLAGFIIADKESHDTWQTPSSPSRKNSLVLVQ